MNVTIRRSDIHGVGVFAAGNAMTGQRIASAQGTPVGHITSFVGDLPSVGYIDDQGVVYVPVFGFPLWVTNYSCKPNIEVRGNGKVYALRSIEPGDELTVPSNGIFGSGCRCGESSHL